MNLSLIPFPFLEIINSRQIFRHSSLKFTSVLVFFLVLLLIISVEAIEDQNNEIKNQSQVVPIPYSILIDENNNSFYRDITPVGLISAEIDERERKIPELYLKIDDEKSTLIQSKEEKDDNIAEKNASGVKNDGHNIPEAGYLLFGSDGKTRVFSSDGTQISYSIDKQQETIISPSGKIMPASHSISVPSGSTIDRVGNNLHVSHQGKLLVTIVNSVSIDKSGSSTLFGFDQNQPVFDNLATPTSFGRNQWAEWVKNESYPNSNLQSFSAQWTIPLSPSLPDISPKGSPVNFIFNGIQPTHPVYDISIIQPVAAYNYNVLRYDGIQWQNRWYGTAWIDGPNDGIHNSSIHSTPIPLNVDDVVTGWIYYIPAYQSDPGYWVESLTSNGQTTTSNTSIYYRERNFTIDPTGADLYLTYEAPFCYPYNNTDGHCEQLPPSNDMKLSDIRFSDIHVWHSIDGVLTEVDPHWKSTVDADTYFHPGLTGLYPDLSDLPDRVTLETNRENFTIVPSVPGTGGHIWPVTEQTVQWGADSQPFTIEAYRHSIIDNVSIINPDRSRVFLGPKATYTFENVQSDYTIEATFKDSDETPISRFITDISDNVVSFIDTSLNSPQEWSWDFGDPSSGILNTATIQNPSHTYRYGGEYTVTLISSNANGAGTTKRYNVSVDGPPPPEADFSASITRGPAAPFTVQFNDTSNGFPTRWSWNFGDGGSSTIQNASHTYLANGTYSVSLTATNPDTGSNTITKTNYITVGPLYATTNGSYTILKFNSTGSTKWTPPAGVTSVDYLVVGGGGEGGNRGIK